MQVEILTAFHVHIGAPIEQVQRSSPTNRYASQLTGIKARTDQVQAAVLQNIQKV